MGFDMNINLIKDAVVEAQRFIDEATKEMDDQKARSEGKGYNEEWFKSSQDRGYLRGSQGTATIKRRSMDLTRSLSKMRQGK